MGTATPPERLEQMAGTRVGSGLQRFQELQEKILVIRRTTNVQGHGFTRAYPPFAAQAHETQTLWRGISQWEECGGTIL